MEEINKTERKTLKRFDSKKELTATERAERILQMCSRVEESRERVKQAEKVANSEHITLEQLGILSPTNIESDNEVDSDSHSQRELVDMLPQADQDSSSEDYDDDIISVAYSHRSVNNLTTGHLKEKLRLCQLTLLKANENFKLKYLRLQSEYCKLKESVVTTQAESQHLKKQTQKIMKERDEAVRNLKIAIDTRNTVMQRITANNVSLREKVEALKQINRSLLRQRETFRSKLDGCTCQDIEMDDFSVTEKKKSTPTKTEKKKSTPRKNKGMLGSWPRLRGQANDGQDHHTAIQYDVSDMDDVSVRSVRSRRHRHDDDDDDGTQSTLSNSNYDRSRRSLSRSGSSISSLSSRQQPRLQGMLSQMWISTREHLSGETESNSSRSMGMSQRNNLSKNENYRIRNYGK